MSHCWKNALIFENYTIKQALEVINREALRIAIVVDEDGKLTGMISDGDIRRGLLEEVALTDLVTEVMNTSPVTAIEGTPKHQLVALMRERDILSIPLLDSENKIVGLETLHSALQIEKHDNPIFIMAGGFGTRLRPLTDSCPKPMLRVGGKPMLETLINHFKASGFYKFYISVHYLPEVITEYFGDGSQFGVEITYVYEDKPLGTGGALSLLPDDIPKSPLIMVNGDILTNVDFAKVAHFHEQNSADATMCVRDYEIKIPFGVIEGEGHTISGIVEKPTYRYFVNAGIYVISHKVIESLKGKNEYLDMPTLFELKQQEGQKVLKFPIHEYWLDIGRHDDFNKAQIDIHNLGLV
ncbi:nucleotidyltransferase family protein [Pseudoalteromonas luteoviolacea]|uniref:Nucleoside-diphosphate-sugar pyrophosphorylase n=1 Tax=Pseudoalteromonas luteoviolacea (strain 2ta16) TaxID=1353533 RepID=V4JJR1_PSEL2|nr:nucleotidyltransferase family protein [Pseudoalteromonas luteoviolacea]ESP95107.1 nucleoside-diphosphate-sugar pyrophosphorylase [Pseudoalteromonas luteoviolacea 2ta16]KZN42281.1 hypothetical protein N483_12210 [Pseudoalteromonas luteoviolacea NCIMB 1944]